MDLVSSNIFAVTLLFHGGTKRVACIPANLFLCGYELRAVMKIIKVAITRSRNKVPL